MDLIDYFLPPLAFAAMLATEENLADIPFETARADLDRLLDQAEAQARRHSPAMAEAALFAVCAYADEAVLESSWPGRQTWMRRKLQEERCHTANAGLEFYERLAVLKAESEADPTAGGDDTMRPRDPENRELLEVYLACLTLGFKGQYDDGREQERIDRLAGDQMGQLLSDGGLSSDKVFPEAYGAPLPAAPPERLHPAVRTMLLYGGPLLLAAAMYATYSNLLSAFVRQWLAAL